MKPRDEAELAELIATTRVPLRIAGGGTRDVGRPVMGEVVSTSGLSGIVHYEPGALTLVARSGTPLADVEAALATEGQRLAFEPMDHRALLATAGVPSIGGVVAANVSGPRRIQAGACRDFLLGVRFADGSGQIIKNGGRVMKNVTGYDLVKLMAGSWGTLGVLTEVSLKVLPMPEAAATLVIEGLDDASAVDVLSRALGAPFEVTGAAHVSDTQPLTLVRVEGFADSVAYRARRLAALMQNDARIEDDPKRGAALWQRVRDVADFAGRPGDVWRISVPPSHGPRLAEAIRRDWPGAEILFDWGGGLVWALVPAGSDVRRIPISGPATLIRADAETRARLGAFAPEPPAIAALSAGLRAKFDPRGILNPELMAPGSEGQAVHADAFH